MGQFSQCQGAQRRGFGGLDHDGAARSRGQRHLAGDHRNQEVQGDGGPPLDGESPSSVMSGLGAESPRPPRACPLVKPLNEKSPGALRPASAGGFALSASSGGPKSSGRVRIARTSAASRWRGLALVQFAQEGRAASAAAMARAQSRWPHVRAPGPEARRWRGCKQHVWRRLSGHPRPIDVSPCLRRLASYRSDHR